MAKLSSTHIYGDLYVDGTISGALSGNASTATTLQTARTINGTSFNGSANITTANWGTARNISIADSDATNTGTAVSVNGSGNVTLKLPATIKATLSGNAATATKATQDSAGQQINTTYIKGLSVSGKTITYTKGDGTTGTITTQDTNTTYSAATTSAAGLMSAADKTKLDGIATSANNYSHPNSGATAGSYGPSANASPAHSGTFSVPYITINAAGHITSASTKTITLPADNNTDTKVTYTLGTTTKYYMGGPTATATGTGGITFDTGIYATTTAGQLSVGSLETRGNITTSGNGSHNIGTTSNRFSGIYGANVYAYDSNAKHYASLRTTTIGTADTQGVGRLIAGNETNAGTAGNAKGQVLLYGTNTGYTTITPGNNSTSSITVTLPSAGGTLPIMSKGDTSYWGICPPDGGTGWIRTTSSGLIPSANGSGALGTSSWQFSSIYGQTIYENGTALSSKYAAASHGTHLTIGTGASNAAAGNHTHNYAASSHNHGLLHNDFGITISDTTTDNGWSMINSSYNGHILKSIRTNANAPTWICNNYAAGVAFGGADTKGVLSCAYNAPSIKIAGGNGSKPVWWVGLTGTSGTTYDLNKIGTASKLSTARTLTIGATGKTFDGSGNVSWSLQDIMKGQGLNASTAMNTLYFNNAGTSHVGRLSCYNNSDGDYVQVALYNTSSSSSVTAVNLYANHIKCTKYMVLDDYIRPKNNGSIDMGASSYRWRTVYSANGVSTTSDRTLKENIKYVRTGETEIDYNDMYKFVKDDLELATYNYINSDEKFINFVAQDLLANEDGTDNVVGQFIVNPVPVPAKEDIENGEDYPLLSYNTNIYTSVLAGALKESINKIEEDNEKIKILENEIKELEIKNKALEELVYSINERLLNLEDNI